MVGKLCIAALAGALVGVERERRDRPAGLRTHIVVCVGSTLITLVSFHLAGPGDDRTRIASQIVSGIGFLGAGTIFRAGTAVKGLTTAAGLWVVAGIGMGIGAGGDLLLVALAAGVLVAATNMWVRLVEDRISRARTEVTLQIRCTRESVPALTEAVSRAGFSVEGLKWLDDPDPASGDQTLRARIEIGDHTNRKEQTLLGAVAELPGVRNVTVQ